MQSPVLSLKWIPIIEQPMIPTTDSGISKIKKVSLTLTTRKPDNFHAAFSIGALSSCQPEARTSALMVFTKDFMVESAKPK